MLYDKLTYNEIIEILKKHTSVSNFCDEDYFLADSLEIDELPEDLKIKLKAYNDAHEQWNRGDKPTEMPPWPYEEVHDFLLNHLNLGPVEEVDSYGGEDCGSTYYSVKYFVKHDIYIRVDGWYQSHYGTDFQDWDEACRQVKPTSKTITVYE